MYKYKLKLKEQDSDLIQFQEKRMSAFKAIESRLNNLYPLLDQATDETANYYKENPESYSVVIATDLIMDYLNDIEKLLNN